MLILVLRDTTSIIRCYTQYNKDKNTLQLWDRSFCGNPSLQAVCDPPISRITGCVSSLRVDLKRSAIINFKKLKSTLWDRRHYISTHKATAGTHYTYVYAIWYDIMFIDDIVPILRQVVSYGADCIKEKWHTCMYNILLVSNTLQGVENEWLADVNTQWYHKVVLLLCSSRFQLFAPLVLLTHCWGHATSSRNLCAFDL